MKAKQEGKHCANLLKGLNNPSLPTPHSPCPRSHIQRLVPTDLLLLADSMGSGLCLQVVLGVPVRVKDDDCVR